MTTPRIPDSATIVAHPDLLANEFDGEVVLLNLRDGVYYGLEDVGLRIWQLLQQPIRVTSICQVLTSEFDVSPEDCLQDVRTLVDELASRGLVEIVEDGAHGEASG
jgi:hypothetical protein